MACRVRLGMNMVAVIPCSEGEVSNYPLLSGGNPCEFSNVNEPRKVILVVTGQDELSTSPWKLLTIPLILYLAFLLGEDGKIIFWDGEDSSHNNKTHLETKISAT